MRFLLRPIAVDKQPTSSIQRDVLSALRELLDNWESYCNSHRDHSPMPAAFLLPLSRASESRQDHLTRLAVWEDICRQYAIEAFVTYPSSDHEPPYKARDEDRPRRFFDSKGRLCFNNWTFIAQAIARPPGPHHDVECHSVSCQLGCTFNWYPNTGWFLQWAL